MRRTARELALQILFQTEFAPQISYSDFLGVFETTLDKSIIEYADTLIRGVQQNTQKIDSIIQSSSANWKVERMALVDRNILRIAVYEIKVAPEPMKPNIAINEAVEVAKKFGSTESSSFINGILDQVSRS
jgi:transcription antitermination protein NusB